MQEKLFSSCSATTGMALSCCASHAAAVYGLGFRVNGFEITVAFSVHPCRKGSNPELFLFVARPVPWEHKSNRNGIGFKCKTIPKKLECKGHCFCGITGPAESRRKDKN